METLIVMGFMSFILSMIYCCGKDEVTQELDNLLSQNVYIRNPHEIETKSN